MLFNLCIGYVIILQKIINLEIAARNIATNANEYEEIP